MKITSHILDTALGKPAAGVRVALAHRADESSAWTDIADGVTDSDGRVADLLAGDGEGHGGIGDDGDGDGGNTPSGEFKLTFHTADYHRAAGIVCFHPRVEIVFTVADADAHYHIPLLISPFGYTTYRGS